MSGQGQGNGRGQGKAHIQPWGLMSEGKPGTPSEGRAQYFNRPGPRDSQRTRVYDNGTALTFGPDDPVTESTTGAAFDNQILGVNGAIRELQLHNVRNAGSVQGGAIQGPGPNAAYDSFRISTLPLASLPTVGSGVDAVKIALSMQTSCEVLPHVWSIQNKSEKPGLGHPGTTSTDTRYGAQGRPGNVPQPRNRLPRNHAQPGYPHSRNKWVQGRELGSRARVASVVAAVTRRQRGSYAVPPARRTVTQAPPSGNNNEPLSGYRSRDASALELDVQGRNLSIPIHAGQLAADRRHAENLVRARVAEEVRARDDGYVRGSNAQSSNHFLGHQRRESQTAFFEYQTLANTNVGHSGDQQTRCQSHNVPRPTQDQAYVENRGYGRTPGQSQDFRQQQSAQAYVQPRRYGQYRWQRTSLPPTTRGQSYVDSRGYGQSGHQSHNVEIPDNTYTIVQGNDFRELHGQSENDDWEIEQRRLSLPPIGDNGSPHVVTGTSDNGSPDVVYSRGAFTGEPAASGFPPGYREPAPEVMVTHASPLPEPPPIAPAGGYQSTSLARILGARGPSRDPSVSASSSSGGEGENRGFGELSGSVRWDSSSSGGGRRFYERN